MFRKSARGGIYPLFILFFSGSVFGAETATSNQHHNGPPSEWIFFGGKIFTSERHRPWAQAIAIRDGRILEVGGNQRILRLARKRTKVVDLEGRVVIPGLNDAHAHVAFFLNSTEKVNGPDFLPGPGPDAAGIYALVGAKASVTPPGTWITGVFGDAFIDDPLANRFELDKVCPHHPVYLYNWAGHGVLLNSLGMALAGIAEDEPDPPGGFYERVAGSDIINGFLHEYAEHRFSRYFKGTEPIANVRNQYLAYGQAVAGFGTTSIQDMAIGFTKYQSEEILSGIDLPIRWHDICFPLDPEESCDSGLGPLMVHDPSNRLVSSGIKWITDGSPIERFANVREPYADLAGWFGIFNWSDELSAILTRSRHGHPVRNQPVLHAVGDQALENILYGLDAFHGTWKNRRVRIEHGDLIMHDLMPQIKRHDVVVVQNPLHFSVGATLLARFGPARFALIQPFRTLLDEGVVLALGSDFVFGPANPFLDIFFAVTHPSNPDEAISVEEAVIAYTWGSAYAEFQEHVKGTLSHGKHADLAVLSQDIFTVPAPAILSTVSVLTMVGGEIVHDDGSLALP